MGPYGENQDPGGSSSGSAVAVTLGLVTAAIGVEVCFNPYLSYLSRAKQIIVNDRLLGASLHLLEVQELLD